MVKKYASIAAASALALAVSFGGVAQADSMTSAQTMTMLTSSGDLMMGSTGSDVVNLQTFLVEKGFLVIPAGVSTGYFGNLTQTALASFQTSVGLPSHGYFGALTRAKISAMMSMMSDSNMNSNMNMNSSGMMASSSAQVGVMVGGALMTPNLDIVENAIHASNVTTVVAAVKAAGLVPTLQGAGPFTVFAPDNNAFAKLPAGTVTTLLMPANLSTLQDILTYHVVAGAYKSTDLYDGEMLTTVEGGKLLIGKKNGQITINGTAMVETPDIISSNGVTYVIDTVLTPPAK